MFPNKQAPSWVVAVLVVCVLVLAKAYLHERDKVVATGVRAGHVETTALSCSDGTQALETAAKQRQQQSAPKQAEAERQAQQLQKQAVQIQSQPAANPSDACASADARIATWWQERAP